MRDLFVKQIFGRIVAKMGVDNGLFRANLVGSQVIGMGMVRYVTQFEPFTNTDIDTVVAAIDPTIQRYVNCDITAP